MENFPTVARKDGFHWAALFASQAFCQRIRISTSLFEAPHVREICSLLWRGGGRGNCFLQILVSRILLYKDSQTNTARMQLVQSDFLISTCRATIWWRELMLIARWSGARHPGLDSYSISEDCFLKWDNQQNQVDYSLNLKFNPPKWIATHSTCTYKIEKKEKEKRKKTSLFSPKSLNLAT